MSDAFSNGASAVAYISVAGTAASSSYNFLRDFASAPQELQSFLHTFDVAQTTIQAFQNTLTQVRNVGFVVGHDAWKALGLATDVANDVNIFLRGLTDGDDTKLTLWKKLEIAIKQKDLLKYSEKLQNATVHILAVQQTICCGFQLKLLELSQRNAAALVEAQENAASAASVSELSTEVNEIRQALSASITALGSDIQTSIHHAFTELKLQSATKTDILALSQKLDHATLGLDSEIRALLDIEPIARKYLAIDQDVACIREEASNLTNKIVLIASRLESLGQGLADVKSRFPAATKILDRLEKLALDMTIVRSAAVDKLWIMQEKLQKLARAMEYQEGISNVASSKTPNSSKPSLGDNDCDKNVTSAEAVPGNLFMHDIGANESPQGRGIAEIAIHAEQNESGTNTSQNSKLSLSDLLKTRNSYLDTERQQELGIQCPTLESSRRSDGEDPDFHWHVSKEQTVRLDALNETIEETNCASITQERQELSSRNRNSSTSSFSTVSSTASIGSIFSVLSTSSMSSVASDHSLDTIARMLTQDSIIMPLCIEAVAIHGHEKFERSLRRLLLTFSRNLGTEPESPSQKVAARFIRLRARRTARLVSQSVGYMDQQASHSGPKLSSKSKQMFTLFENLSIDEVPSDYSDSDDDLEIDASEFEKLTEFALNSKAFQKLREDLGSLVFQEKKPPTLTSITYPICPVPGHIYDPCTVHPDISCQHLSAIKTTIPPSLDADGQSSSQISDCKTVHEVEAHLGSDSCPRNIGLEKLNEILCAITRPICETYRIWLPAIVGGWLGYMLHEFWSSERQEQSG